jgi:hypothetical protein
MDDFQVTHGVDRDSNYTILADVLQRAFQQAASGKGAERHGQDLPFDKQPMQTISQLVGSQDGLIYQAMKKAQESQRMPVDRAVRELLGAINYLAGAVIELDRQHTAQMKAADASCQGTGK